MSEISNCIKRFVKIFSYFDVVAGVAQRHFEYSYQFCNNTELRYCDKSYLIDSKKKVRIDPVLMDLFQNLAQFANEAQSVLW